VDGKNIAEYSRKQLIGFRREEIGFVFQFYNLVQNLTALENVELAVQICKDYRDPEEVLDRCGSEGPDEQFSCPAFRRRAAEGGHCPGAGEESETPAL
jgi:ABC-type multidrug transport system ATPase subunit